MAYIIGEPIIEVCAEKTGGTLIRVRFPVKDTHVDDIHYRGCEILLRPEQLWMLNEKGVPPRYAPKVLPPIAVTEDTYGDTLVLSADVIREVKRHLQHLGVEPEEMDPHALQEVKNTIAERLVEEKYGRRK